MVLHVTDVCACLFQVFIEFETVLHADRFQVWYDIYHTLQSDTGHKLEKLRMPKDVAVSEQQLATDSLTTGEMLEKHLDLNKIGKKSKRETIVYILQSQMSACHLNFTASLPYFNIFFLISFSSTVRLKSQNYLSPKVSFLKSLV